jgi:hypothetical protein
VSTSEDGAVWAHALPISAAEHELWAQALHRETVVRHLRSLASSKRALGDDQRKALLQEAARRLEFSAPRLTDKSVDRVLECLQQAAAVRAHGEAEDLARLLCQASGRDVPFWAEPYEDDSVDVLAQDPYTDDDSYTCCALASGTGDNQRSCWRGWLLSRLCGVEWPRRACPGAAVGAAVPQVALVNLPCRAQPRCRQSSGWMTTVAGPWQDGQFSAIGRSRLRGSSPRRRMRWSTTRTMASAAEGSPAIARGHSAGLLGQVRPDLQRAGPRAGGPRDLEDFANSSVGANPAT